MGDHRQRLLEVARAERDAYLRALRAIAWAPDDARAELLRQLARQSIDVRWGADGHPVGRISRIGKLIERGRAFLGAAR